MFCHIHPCTTFSWFPKMFILLPLRIVNSIKTSAIKGEIMGGEVRTQRGLTGVGIPSSPMPWSRLTYLRSFTQHTWNLSGSWVSVMLKWEHTLKFVLRSQEWVFYSSDWLATWKFWGSLWHNQIFVIGCGNNLEDKKGEVTAKGSTRAGITAHT